MNISISSIMNTILYGGSTSSTFIDQHFPAKHCHEMSWFFAHCDSNLRWLIAKLAV